MGRHGIVTRVKMRLEKQQASAVGKHHLSRRLRM